MPAFYVDMTEVSNRAYAKFCKQTQCTAPAGAPDEPVVNVTFEDASRFAAWAGKRLPTEDEWEKAARGPSGLQYPGQHPRRDACKCKGQSSFPDRLMPVDSFPEGKSPYGVLNLCGNAWEWTSTVMTPDPGAKEAARTDPSLNPPLRDDDKFYAVKGGSFERNLVGDERVPMNDAAATVSRTKASDIGFRCAKDAR